MDNDNNGGKDSLAFNLLHSGSQANPPILLVDSGFLFAYPPPTVAGAPHPRAPIQP